VAIAPNLTSTQHRAKSFVERWYFVAMAIVILAVSIAGFMPAIVHLAGRRAPLSLLAAAHGIVFFAWQLLFLAQSLLAATDRIRWHRRLGFASLVLLAAIIPLGFETTAAMVIVATLPQRTGPVRDQTAYFLMMHSHLLNATDALTVRSEIAREFAEMTPDKQSMLLGTRWRELCDPALPTAPELLSLPALQRLGPKTKRLTDRRVECRL
jgi:hypothetical protein